MPNILLGFAKVFAGLASVYVAWNFGYVVVKYSLGRLLFSHKRRLASRRAGDWVVISGGSAGIGLAMAREFAKWGLDIFIISNDEAGLQLASAAIQLEFGVQTKYYVSDLTTVSTENTLSETI